MNPSTLMLIRVNARRGTHPLLRESNVTGLYPPLGLAYLAAAARARGYTTSIVDAHALDLSPQDLARMAATRRPDVIGFTATTFDWPLVQETARSVHRAAPQALILAGGPQLSLYPEECLEEESVDAAVVGEGDEAITEILDRTAAGASLDGISGIVLRRGREIHREAERKPLRNLDALPMPAIDLLPRHRYRAITVSSPFMTMVTSRGCPFRCRYCSQRYVGGAYREHGAQRVVAEMARAVRVFGAREIVFFDETFTVNRDRVLEICRGIRDAGLSTRWNVRTRPDLLDGELLAAMHEGGCASIHVGTEAGSERVRRRMGRDLDEAKAARSLGEARRIGMESRGYFMIGLPGETLAEIESTVRLACELPLDWASFTIATPLPGTEIYEEAVRSGRFAGDCWKDYTRGLATGPPVYFVSEAYDTERLEDLLRRAYMRFYLRPRRIAATLSRTRLWRMLPGTLRTLLEVGTIRAPLKARTWGSRRGRRTR